MLRSAVALVMVVLVGPEDDVCDVMSVALEDQRPMREPGQYGRIANINNK